MAIEDVSIGWKKGSATDWSSANPVLANGVVGFDYTNNEIRVGDGITAWNSLTVFDPDTSDLCGGGVEYYSFNTLPGGLSEQEDGAYAGLAMDSVPTNFLTNQADWWFAVRIARISHRASQGSTLVDGGVLNGGWAWQSDGKYLMSSNTSSFLISLDTDTPARSNQWIIVQWDDTTSKLDCWVGGVQELNQRSVSAPTSSTPSNASWLRVRYSSNYFYNFLGSVSAIIVGNGYNLTAAEAESIAQSHIKYSDLPAAVQAKTSHAWSFNSKSVVTDKGSIGLTPESNSDAGGVGSYEFVKDTFAIAPPIFSDTSLTLYNSGDSDVSITVSGASNSKYDVTYPRVNTGYADSNTDFVSDSNTGLFAYDDGGGTWFQLFKNPPGNNWILTTVTTDPSTYTTGDSISGSSSILAGSSSTYPDETVNGYTVPSDSNALISHNSLSASGVSEDLNLANLVTYSGTGVLSYSKVSGESWMGSPVAGIANIDANGVTASDYTGTYRVEADGNTDDMTLSVTVRDTPFFSEDWEGDTSSWTIVDDATSVNQWEIGTATAYAGTKSAYVSNNGGTSNAYTDSDTAVAHIYKDFTTPSDISNGCSLKLYWKGVGESTFDYMRISICPTSVTPVGGTLLNTSYNVLGGTNKLNGNSSWTSETIEGSTLDALIPSASTTYRLVFTWNNDGSVGTNPPSAIDDITITAL